MSIPVQHLTATSLEQLAEGTLPAAELAHAQSHLDECARCSGEVESYRHLFAMLGSMSRFAPSPVFAEGVMARVQIAPQESVLAVWLRRLIPTTKRGWLLVGTLVTAPATPILALIAVILLQPLVTPTNLWQWGSLQAQSLVQSATAWMLDLGLSLGIWEWVAAAYTTLESIPIGALTLLAALMAFATPLSAWGLIKLIRTPVARVHHAN